MTQRLLIPVLETHAIVIIYALQLPKRRTPQTIPAQILIHAATPIHVVKMRFVKRAIIFLFSYAIIQIPVILTRAKKASYAHPQETLQGIPALT
jgi:hypothetical protein